MDAHHGLEVALSTDHAPRARVRDLIAGMSPSHDPLEHEHRAQALAWIDSGAPLWRTEAPATPDPHLVTYIVPFDAATGRVLLVDHRKAGLWLPPGGHAEPGEDPRATVVREAREELDVAAVFHSLTDDLPLLLTATPTRGARPHTDVSLWFLIDLPATTAIRPDPSEFAAARWVSVGGHDFVPGVTCEPHLHRLEAKLRSLTP